jgi:hypothetical protein
MVIKINKKGQDAIGMSFGWLFSLILIIVFIFVAIYGINYFLNMGKCTKVGLFYDSLQQKIDDAYQSSSSDFELSVNLPGVTQICFANLTQKITGSDAIYKQIELYSFYDANTFIIPSANACDMPYKTLKHLDVNRTISAKNPFCVDVTEGGTIRIVKGYYDKGVIVK